MSAMIISILLTIGILIVSLVTISRKYGNTYLIDPAKSAKKTSKQ